MTKNSIVKNESKRSRPAAASSRRLVGAAVTAALGLALWGGASGCQSEHPLPPSFMTAGTNAPSLVLHEGDNLQIKFPGAPEMDALQTIRSDGKITINMVGDIKVSGLTTDAARQALLDACGPQLKVKEVTVTVQSSAFIVYVIGSIERPGEMISDRTLTPFEAVIRAGIDTTKSNLRKVKIIRKDANGRTEQTVLDLQKLINTPGQTETFTLKPFDVIYVPEKFSVF
jgi:polysaccharide export outer membrane protein